MVKWSEIRNIVHRCKLCRNYGKGMNKKNSMKIGKVWKDMEYSMWKKSIQQVATSYLPTYTCVQR